MAASYKDLLKEAAAEFDESWSRGLRRLSICPTCGKRLKPDHVCQPPKVVPCRIEDCHKFAIARRLCSKHYHQWLRRKNSRAWVKERAKPSLLLCRCGREQRAHGRCNRCYLAYRKRNPNQCECGKFYARGTKCGACYKRDRRAAAPRCLCKLHTALKGKSLCRTCQNLEDNVMCTHCDRGLPVKTSHRCAKCLFEAYRASEAGKRQHRQSEKRRTARIKKDPFHGVRVVRRV